MTFEIKRGLVGVSILINALAIAIYIDGYHQWQQTKTYEKLVAEYEMMADNDSDMLINCSDLLDGADPEEQMEKALETFKKKDGNVKVINSLRDELGLD
jgi:hypothetical protein